MRVSLSKLLVPIGIIGLTAWLAGCNGEVRSPASAAPASAASTPSAKAACGGAALATSQMRCPPGFTAPAA